MGVVTSYRTPDASLLVFSGSLEDAYEQGFIAAEQRAFLEALTPEALGVAPETWEGITGIEIFESAPQGAT